MDIEPPVALLNPISVVREKLLEKQYAHDFPEKEYKEKREMSLHDRKFMQIASSVTFKDGCYYLSLPFHDRNAIMPNSYQIAKQQALHLETKIQRDEVYVAEYKVSIC